MRPQKYAQTESIYSALGDPTQVVPHQDQREGMLPLGDNRLIRIPNPINDLNKLPNLNYEGQDFMTDTLGGSVPWLKGLVELAQNKQIYNGQPIDYPNQDGTPPTDIISRLLNQAGAGKLVGIDNSSGLPSQNETAAYLMRQLPWNYWSRNLFAPPEEWLAKGLIAPQSSLDRRLGALGLRTKTSSPTAIEGEIDKRINHLLEK